MNDYDLYSIAQAAELGVPDALYELGIIFKTGEPLSQRDDGAFDSFKKAAEQGHSKAQYECGLCYSKGTGTRQDSDKAVYWFLKAAAQGHTESQFHCFRAYRDASGVKSDVVKGLYWCGGSGVSSRSGGMSGGNHDLSSVDSPPSNVASLATQLKHLCFDRDVKSCLW